MEWTWKENKMTAGFLVSRDYCFGGQSVRRPLPPASLALASELCCLGPSQEMQSAQRQPESVHNNKLRHRT
ncbi:hypothetical protein DPEC_G00188730 [Dallia pectoralis]|uniref:Uncharacterized protein n=1 Tax=Dallia pectoralis TaxID=75939 RepID=A0ACC2GCC5_DALPE|nr:hypothetical protein DPEC_G00188730 [Dallia pectoralis]